MFTDTAPKINDSDNNLLFKIAQMLNSGGGGGGGVTSFNTRTGAVVLLSADVTAALGFTPISQADGDARYVLKAGDTMTGALTIGNGVLVASAPALNLNQTWNNGAVTFNGLFANYTNTASASDSSLFNFQTDSIDRFRFNTIGQLFAARQDATNSGMSLFLRKRGNSGGATNAVAADSTVGTVQFSSWDGTAYANGSRISGLAAEAWTNIAHGARLDIYTTPVGSTTEQISLRLESTGQAKFLDGTAAIPAVSFQSDPDIGLYRVGANSLGLSVNGVLALTVNTTSAISVGTILSPDGTAALPAFSFSADTDTGLYRIGANSVGVSVAGVLALTVNATNLISVGAILAPDGTAALPGISFSGGAGITGLYRISAGNLGFSAAGVLALTLNSTSLISVGTVLLPNGTAALPGVAFSGDTNTGVYNVGADTLGFSTGGVLALTIASTANATFVGTVTSPSASLTGAAGLTLISTGVITWTSRGTLSRPADGVVLLQDTAGTSFARLQFGGTTSSFPAIKRNGAALNFRLADDSAGCDITASGLTITNSITCSQLAVGAGGYVTWGGSTYIFSPSAGVLRLTDSATTDFLRLQFGGTTSSFPAIKKSGATLQFRLADDSAFCGISTAAIVMSVAAPLSITSGTNQRAGNAVLVGGTVTVNNTTVTANTIVILTRKTAGGTIGFAVTYTVTAATSFTITSDNALDTSTYSYLLIEVP